MEQTWINFKSHFREAQQELNNIQGPTLHASTLNANLVKSVVDGDQEVFLPDDDLIEKVANSVASTSALSNAQYLEHVNKL